MYRIKESVDNDGDVSYVGEKKLWFGLWEYISGTYSFNLETCNRRVCVSIDKEKDKYHEVNCNED